MAKFMPACKRIQGSLWRYIDRELSAPALAEISAHLKSCPDCQRVFEARACDAKLYRMAFVESPFGEAFVERFRRRVDGEPAPVARIADGDASTVDQYGGAFPREGAILRRYLPEVVLANPRRFLARLALTAALLTIGVSIFYGLRPDTSLGAVVARGDLTLNRGGKVLPAIARDLRPGDRYLLDGADAELRVNLSDGSALVLSGPADFLVDEASRTEGRFIAHLESGELRASVNHRETGREMKIYSPDAEARVVGTRFTLRVEPRRGTTLEVQEGEVRFRWFGGEEVPVNVATGPRFAPKGLSLNAHPESAPVAATGGKEPVEKEAQKPPVESDGDAPGVESSPAPAPAGSPGLDQPVEEKPAPEIPAHLRESVDQPAR